MSSYSGDCSSSGSSDFFDLRPIQPATTTMANGLAPAGTTPGLNNFLYGMHRFQSAEELHYYLERIGGPGAIVNITDAVHVRPQGNASGISTAAGNRGVLAPLPQPAISGLGALGNHSSLLSSNTTGFTTTTNNSRISWTGTPSITSTPPAGYIRNTYIVGCGIHDRATVSNSNAGRTNTNVSSLLPFPELSGPDVMHIGNCCICQRTVIEDFEGRMMAALPHTNRRQ